MTLHIIFEDGPVIKLEIPEDIGDLPVLVMLGYSEARNWLGDPNNYDIVRAHVARRAESPLASRIDASGLFDIFCENVWGQKPPEAPEYALGFCVGVAAAVKQLRGLSAA